MLRKDWRRKLNFLKWWLDCAISARTSTVEAVQIHFGFCHVTTFIIHMHISDTCDYIMKRTFTCTQIWKGRKKLAERLDQCNRTFSEFQIGFSILFLSFMRNNKTALVYFGFGDGWRAHWYTTSVVVCWVCIDTDIPVRKYLPIIGNVHHVLAHELETTTTSSTETFEVESPSAQLANTLLFSRQEVL